MENHWIEQLEHWREFFLLSGTGGVTLTGVLFIVISLGPKIIAREMDTGVRAFFTPQVVLFATVLVISNALMAPAIPQELIGWLLCIGAVASIVYLWSTHGHRRWRENGLPVRDWIWYIALPYLAYVLVLIEGAGILRDDMRALPAAGATMVLMLVIGIRNAWDLAVWMPQQELNSAALPNASTADDVSNRRDGA
jgi:hypothetical protein